MARGWTSKRLPSNIHPWLCIQESYHSHDVPCQHRQVNTYQARQVVSLQLGLPVQSLQDRCRCGESFSSDGGHALCCKQWAGKSWVRGHDLMVEQVGYEIKRVGKPVTTDKNFLTLLSLLRQIHRRWLCSVPRIDQSQAKRSVTSDWMAEQYHICCYNWHRS